MYCRTRPFIAAHGSTIIGGTSLAQLEENLDVFSLPLDALCESTIKEIDEVHMRCRDPSDTL